MDRQTKIKFTQAVREKLDEAAQLFGVNMSDVAIELNIRGVRIAGQACRPKMKYGRWTGYRVRFNPLMIAEHFDEMVNSTVPHEIAHMVCFKRPELGRKHDFGWKTVARKLGDTNLGSRTHNMKVENAPPSVRRQTRMYKYRTTSGRITELSQIRHRRCQQGLVYCLRADGSKVKREGYLGPA